jgi:hypothetical protein
MKRITLLTGGAVAAALVLVAGAVTVASALGAPADSSRVLDDHGIDTATVSPAATPTPSPTGSHHATPEPGDDHGQDGVVSVPPAGPTVIDRHGDKSLPDDDPGAHDQGGDDQGAGRGGHGGGDRSGDDNGRHGGDDDRQ